MGNDPPSSLVSADWQDRFEGEFAAGGLTSLQVARLLLEEPPSWIHKLMKARNGLVALCGLKAVEMKLGTASGGFPIVETTPERTVLGFDDAHLNFRIVVDVRGSGGGQVVGVSTLVRRKNLLGRLYMLVVGPFHRRIVPVMLRNLCTNVRPA